MRPADHIRPFAESHPDDRCGDGMWRAYLTAAEDEDAARVESWNGSTTGILTFTGLFAATVAAFVIESYKALSPDTGAQTVALLAQLVAATNTTPVIPAIDIQSGPFLVTETAIVVNSLWFLSLVISLVCALLATLIQEWTRDYLRDIQRRTSTTTIAEFALNHVYVRIGVDRWGLDKVATVIVGLMHLAVGLFLVGLGIFLFPIYTTPAWTVVGSASGAAALYVCASGLLLLDNSCPYRTPLTYGLRELSRGIALCLNILLLSIDSIYAMLFKATKKLSHIWHPPSDAERFWAPVFKDNYPGSLADLFGNRVIAWLMFSTARRIPQNVSSDRYFDEDGKDHVSSFLTPVHMSGIWQYTGEYVFGPDGRPALLDYTPLRLLRTRWAENRPFVLDLFGRLWKKSDVKERIASLQNISEGIGALKFIQETIAVQDKYPRDINFLPARTPSWIADTVMEDLVRSIPNIGTLNVKAGAEGDLSWLVVLSIFRQTLFIGLHAQLNSLGDKGRKRLIGELEALRGLRLLPLYASDEWLPDVNPMLYEHSGERPGDEDMWTRFGAPDMAARNVFTLVAYLVLSPPQSYPDESIMLLTWKMLAEDFGWRTTADEWKWDEFGLSLFEESNKARERRPASSLFVKILERVGLNSWLKLEDPETEYYPFPDGFLEGWDHQKREAVTTFLNGLAHLVILSPDQEPLSDIEFAQIGLILPGTTIPMGDSRPSTNAETSQASQMMSDTHSAVIAADVNGGELPDHVLEETSQELDDGGSAVPHAVGENGSVAITSNSPSDDIPLSNVSAAARVVETATENPGGQITVGEESNRLGSLAVQQSPGDDSVGMMFHSPSDDFSPENAPTHAQDYEMVTLNSVHRVAENEETEPPTSPALQIAEEGRLDAGGDLGQIHGEIEGTALSGA